MSYIINTCISFIPNTFLEIPITLLQNFLQMQEIMLACPIVLLFPTSLQSIETFDDRLNDAVVLSGLSTKSRGIFKKGVICLYLCTELLTMQITMIFKSARLSGRIQILMNFSTP